MMTMIAMTMATWHVMTILTFCICRHKWSAAVALPNNPLCPQGSSFVWLARPWWDPEGQGPMAVVHYCDCSLTSGTGLGLPDNLIIPQFPPPGSLQCNGPPTSHLFSTKLTENLIWLAFLCEPYLISIGLWKESDHNENWQPKIRRHCTAVHWCNRYKYRLSLPSECESIILIQLFNGWTTLLSLRKLWSDPNLTACHMWTCWQTYFWILQVPGCLEPTN